MSDLDSAIDAVRAEVGRIPEVETVDGREVYDKAGRLVCVFDDSRHAIAFVDLMSALPELIDHASGAEVLLGEAQALIDDQNEKLAEKPKT